MDSKQSEEWIEFLKFLIPVLVFALLIHGFLTAISLISSLFNPNFYFYFIATAVLNLWIIFWYPGWGKSSKIKALVLHQNLILFLWHMILDCFLNTEPRVSPERAWVWPKILVMPKTLNKQNIKQNILSIVSEGVCL